MPKSPEEYRLLSDWEGLIKHLLLSLDIPDLTFADVKIRFGNLLQAFADRNPLITVLSPTPIVVPDDVCMNSGGPELHIVDLSAGGTTRPNSTKWVQDQLVVARNPATDRSRLTDSASDQGMAEVGSLSAFVAQLAADYGYEHQTVAHKVTGGEILCGGDYALCGNDLLPKAAGGRARTDAGSRAAITKALRQTLGVKHIVWIDKLMRGALHSYGGSRNSSIQDDFDHIDMLITPGGPVDGNPNTHLMFVAQICPEYCAPAQSFSRSKIFSETQVLDCIARGLAAEHAGDINFEVERVPMFVNASSKGLQFKSFNNALVEVEGGERRVYLPDYVENPGMEICMDAYLQVRELVRKVYTSRGFEVRFVAGHFPADLGTRGALRCASKVLGRNV